MVLHFLSREGECDDVMYLLYTLAVILFVLWLVAVITHFVVSAAIHTVLVAAVVLFIVGLMMGRRTVA